MAARQETNKKYDQKRQDWRARAWQCVVYEESAPKDWLDKLHSQGVAYDVSPRHDKDKTADGEVKKPHWHVVLDWGSGSTTSGNRAIEIFDLIGGVYPNPEKDRKAFLEKCKVKKLLSAQRYLCHLDEHDPDKFKYDTSEVKSGFQELPYELRTLKEMEKDEMTLSMIDFVLDEGITDFAQFVIQAREKHPEWMHSVINDKPGTFVNRFINGLQQGMRLKKDLQNQEIQHRKYLLDLRTFEECSLQPIPRQFIAPYGEKLDSNDLFDNGASE